jgi:hypothetical protein
MRYGDGHVVEIPSVAKEVTRMLGDVFRPRLSDFDSKTVCV